MMMMMMMMMVTIMMIMMVAVLVAMLLPLLTTMMKMMIMISSFYCMTSTSKEWDSASFYLENSPLQFTVYCISVFKLGFAHFFVTKLFTILYLNERL